MSGVNKFDNFRAKYCKLVSDKLKIAAPLPYLILTQLRCCQHLLRKFGLAESAARPPQSLYKPVTIYSYGLFRIAIVFN